MSEHDLLFSQIKAQHDDGWAALYVRDFAPLARFAQHLGVPVADSEDVVQEALIRLLRHAADLDVSRNPLAWLRRVVYSTAMDYHRRARRRPQSLPLPADWEVLASSEQERLLTEQAETRATLAWVAVGLRHLPTAERAALLRKGLGYTDAEQAVALGLPLGTVKSRIRRGRGRLTAALAPLGEPGRSWAGGAGMRGRQ